MIKSQIFPKKKHRFSDDQLPHFVSLMDNFMFFLVPMLAGQFHSGFFIVFQGIMVLGRLLVLVHLRKGYSRYEFVKEIFNKMLWVLYHICFLFLYAINNFDMQQSKKYVGIGILLLLLIGICVETLFSLIDFLISVK